MSSQPAQILVVDDEAEIRSMLSEFLSDPQHQCSTADSGVQALEMLAKRRFDLLVSDIAMPGMSGFELLDQVQSLRPECTTILMTGVGTTDWAKRAIRGGAFDYLEKPFDLDTLRRVINSALAADAVLRGSPLVFGEHPPGTRFADALTQLPNHRAFIEELGRMRAYCRRLTQPVAVLLADVDGFHALNQRYGHACGDVLLTQLGARLRTLARRGDLVARYRWDEFVLALPNAESEAAARVADRCRLAISGTPFPWRGSEIQCTVSIGLAECESGFVETDTHLLHRAEEALAEAKSRGGDTVVSWRDLGRHAGNAEAPEPQGVQAIRGEFQRLQHQLTQSHLESMRALVAAVEAKDPYTQKHSLTVAHYAHALAVYMGMPEAEADPIRTAAVLHDIGKIGIPDSILVKPGPLTADEFALIRRHPIVGTQILEHVSFLRSELPLILHHHERWDGSGYPVGLAREQIPQGARVLHVADALDAMLSQRSYKAGLTLDHAVAELKRGMGTQFDPVMADAMVRWIDANPKLIVHPDQRDELVPAVWTESGTPVGVV